MSRNIPDWYRGWADAVLSLRAATVSEIAFERSSFLTGYVTALVMADLIATPQCQRMHEVENNALHYALQNLKTPTHKKEA